MIVSSSVTRAYAPAILNMEFIEGFRVYFRRF